MSNSRRLVALLSACGLIAIGAGLGGCPIYSADSCDQDPSCPGVAQPVYDTGTPSGGCGVCSPGYVCTALSSGRDSCVPYDCRAPERSCSSGYTCSNIGGGVYTCVGGSDAGHDGDGDAGVDATPLDCRKTGCISGYSCNLDAKSGNYYCLSTDPLACVVDGDCPSKTGDGSLCLGGVCKAPKDLCTDSTQCKTGKDCVDGRCVDTCSSGDAGDAGATSCDDGYACVSGACVGGTGACGAAPSGDAGVDGSSDAGASCSSKTSCVATRCVDKCAVDGSCASGMVCVGAGCVQDDRPVFYCDKSGTADGTQDVCATGSICLHHNCYLACTGPTDTTSCTDPAYPVCKSVTTSSGQHDVCGSNTGLGSDCDPTSTPPKSCAAGQFCIDGFCK